VPGVRCIAERLTVQDRSAHSRSANSQEFSSIHAIASVVVDGSPNSHFRRDILFDRGRVSGLWFISPYQSRVPAAPAKV
jgi:hypothetical protein